MLERLDRRKFLTAAAGTGLALTSGRAGSAVPLKRRASVRIGWTGASCEAATYVAVEKGLFAREGLDVELVRLGDPLAAHDAIAAGTIDAVSAPLYSWLRPIQRGLDARLTAGLHGGCIRLVASRTSTIRELGELKGATIATDRINGPTMDFFAALLRKREIDPARDVRWRAYRPVEFAGALEAGHVQVVAANDPAGYSLVRGRLAVAITDNLAAGIFYCDRGISHSHNCFIVMRGAVVRRQPRVAAGLTWAWRDATRWVGANVAEAAQIAVDSNMSGLFLNNTGLSHHHFCCVVALRGGLVRDDPKTAATVTRAWLDGSRWVGKHIDQTAKFEVDKKYVASDVPTITNLLSSYEWRPSADLVFEDIQLGARDFLKAGILDKRTDPDDLAKRAYVDIFRQVAEV